MSTAPTLPTSARAGSPWRAPLVPAALAFTAGVLLDRHVEVPLAGSVFVAVVMLVTWLSSVQGEKTGLTLVYLALALVALGTAYHHYRQRCHPADDVGWIVEDGPRILQVRGTLDDDPRLLWRPASDPLRTPRGKPAEGEPTLVVLTVNQVRGGEGWRDASGKVQMFVGGPLEGLGAGDEVETVGRLEALQGPQNPGERDFASEQRGAGVRAVLRVRYTADVVVRLEPASWASPTHWRSRVRGWGNRTLREALPAPQSGLAAALLLGDGNALSPPEWAKYQRTGVIHVLVVSGQHLAVLGGFLHVLLRLTRMRSRTAILLVVIVLWSYALLTGARPSVIRAAATVTVLALAQLLRRPAHPVNSLAAAWVLVLLLNPADVNDIGCLLSFVCVAALYWLDQRWRKTEEEIDPIERLKEESRPAWLRQLRWLGGMVLQGYLVSFVLWLVVVPLTVSRLHSFPLTGLLIGPPVVLLTSFALIAGFLFLLLSLALPPLAPLLATMTCWLLMGCEALVDLGTTLGTRHTFVNSPPSWWVIAFYLALGALFLFPVLLRQARLVVLGLAGWATLGAAMVLVRIPSSEMRVTFLAVEHGGCTVIETPDGRVLLYDAGSLRGPPIAVTRVAPFLWERGIRRIDEVFLSHADLDHFNGLVELLDRFPIGQVTHTPSFALKDNRAVRHVIDALENRGVSVRIVSQGDRLTAGEVTLEVLHPPEEGPQGVENVRSLVLMVGHGRNRILVTGDLEGAGLRALTSQPPRHADVLMAPHHGSRAINPKGLLSWSQPSVVISCQAEKPPPVDDDPYAGGKFRFLETNRHGAITVRSHATGLVVETFTSRERFALRPVNDR